ncbi:MAG: EI24 domain-containing protein [Spirochaetes bacterium]|nr:EI24 domain-containing protein [Spirochaetota bacterium]
MTTHERHHSGSFFRGFVSFFRAIPFIVSHRGFGWYFIIPFILNIVVLVTVFIISYRIFDTWFSGLLAGTAWYMVVLRVLLKPVLFVLLSIVSVLVYSITGCIVTAPFNDFLSMKVERVITGEGFDEKFRFTTLLKDIIRITAGIMILLLLMLLLNIILLFLNLVPFFGQVLYSVMSFLTASFFIGYQFFDFPMERRRLGFSEKFWIAWHHKWLVAGLGAAFFLASYIPVLGFLGLNCATIGATILFIEHIRNDLPAGAAAPRGDRA